MTTSPDKIRIEMPLIKGVTVEKAAELIQFIVDECRDCVERREVRAEIVLRLD